MMFFGRNEKTMQEKDIFQRIRDNMDQFSKGQMRIAEYIKTDYDKAAFMTANKLGSKANASESTVVRFATKLGYDGYPAMQKALQTMVRSKLTSVQRIQVARDRIGDQDILPTVMEADMDNIRMTLEECDRDNFYEVVDTVLSAKRIYILGARSAAALSDFLGFYFHLIFDNVAVVQSYSANDMFEQLLRVEQGDVVIGISFPRYSKRTIQAMHFACSRGAKVIAVTDGPNSPLLECSTHALLARSDMVSFADSLAAPLSMLNALIVAVSRGKNEDLSQTFEELEDIWEEYQVYEKVDETPK